MTSTRFSPVQLSLTGFVAILVLAWFCYQPALSGAFQLDDRSHFEGLASVDDLSSTIDYVLSGTNGPTGRPIAMLSFAMQASQLEGGAAAFLTGNLAIHLLNGILLFWFAYELASACTLTRDRAVLIAVATSSIWLMLPLNATASMLAVQRMTTLGATFSLVGLAGYLAARRRCDTGPYKRLTLMTAILILSTVAATLTKESGLLLPLFVLVLESTVLQRPETIPARNWMRWKLLVLALPGAALLAYLASRSVYPEWMVARRDLNGWERLLTQAQVLWLYVSKAVVGLPSRLGIYQSEIAIARSLLDPAVLLSVLAWIALSAYSLLHRRRYPLLAIAVLWFLVGHLLESTVLPLELYFEHRNYLPLVGPVFALCAFLLGRTKPVLRVGLASIVAFVMLNAGFLYLFASLWGEPSASARYWAYRYPDSVRAVTTLATHQLTEEGPQRSIDTVRQYVAQYPEHGYLQIQELNLLCLFGASGDLSPIVAELGGRLHSVNFTYSAGNMLSELFSTATQGKCDVTPDTVGILAAALLQNPRYVGDPYYNQFHHKLLAGITRHEGRTAEALQHLDIAMSYWPTPELNMMMIIALVDQGEFARAEEVIDDAMLAGPANPLKAIAWRRDLQRLRQYVHEVATYARDGEHDQDSQDQ